MPKVWFVGAGPGDPDLITVRGRDLIARAGAILYAGSLVAQTHLDHAPDDCDIADSSSMPLESIVAWLKERSHRHAVVLRLQTGDPSLYGALPEMTEPLQAEGVEVGVVPGVSSAMAAAAATMESLTLPEVTQTVIFTRTEGRTPMPKGERLRDLARHRTTLCIFLSATLMDQVAVELRAAGWSNEAPVVVVQKVSWPGEERIFRSTVGTFATLCHQEQVRSQAMIIAGPALSAHARTDQTRSRLYDSNFSHSRR